MGYQKKKEVNAKKHEERTNFLQTYNVRDMELEKRREMQHATNQYLFDLGAKKNGMTSGLPVNPINHEYMNSYGGKQLQHNET